MHALHFPSIGIATMFHTGLLFLRHKRFRAPSWGMGRITSALALGCAALALVACGGGSGDSNEPTANIPAPEDFRMEFWSDWLSYVDLKWAVVPGATRYELFADPDGPGSLPETLVEPSIDQGSHGEEIRSLRLSYEPEVSRFDAIYRVRACDDAGCGAFAVTTPRVWLNDYVAEQSREFSTGFSSHRSFFGRYDLSLSRDGLTLYKSLGVFVRASKDDAWQLQHVFPNSQRGVLSADGNTLAIEEDDRILMYARTNGSWREQAVITVDRVPPFCTWPCFRPDRGPQLSDDGNILAVRSVSGEGGQTQSGVAIYARIGDTWTPQAFLTPNLESVGLRDNIALFVALSGDGKTLAMNAGSFGWEDPSNKPPQPYVYVFAQNAAGVWGEQAHMPADFYYQTTFGAVNAGTISLSIDGNALAISGAAPSYQAPVSNAMGIPALSCASSGDDGQVIQATQSSLTLFARTGETWSGQVTILAAPFYLFLSPDGDQFIYRYQVLSSDGNQFADHDQNVIRRNGVWTCPAP